MKLAERAESPAMTHTQPARRAQLDKSMRADTMRADYFLTLCVSLVSILFSRFIYHESKAMSKRS